MAQEEYTHDKIVDGNYINNNTNVHQTTRIYKTLHIHIFCDIPNINVYF